MLKRLHAWLYNSPYNLKFTEEQTKQLDQIREPFASVLNKHGFAVFLFMEGARQLGREVLSVLEQRSSIAKTFDPKGETDHIKFH